LSPQREKQGEIWAQVGFYSGLGFIIPIAVIVAYVLGWLLDRELGTSPVLAIVMAFVGLAGGIWETVRILTQREKSAAENDGSNGPGQS
jgi:F0F1-type ATP synthase assembly protein I